jgi:uncharacterized protein DUF4352
MGDRKVRRLVLAAVTVVVLSACGTSAQTAKNPEPAPSTPPRVHTAAVGDVIMLTGAGDTGDTSHTGGPPGLRLAVKVKEIVSSTTGRGAFERPRKGERFAAVRFVLKNVGEVAYHDSPTFGAKLVDAEGHTYDPTVVTVTAGPGFGRAVTLLHGQVRSGFIVFAIPRNARVAAVRYALDAGDAPDLGDWHVH